MKMILGLGAIDNYGSYINNCQAKQWPYKIPVNNLSEVQLYISIGSNRPSLVEYQLIHTCGPTAGTIETLMAINYIIGQDTSGNWYGVFKNLISSNAKCFVVGITLTTNIETYLTQAAAPPSSGSSATVYKISDFQWCNNFGKLFASGYGPDGNGTVQASLTTPHFWFNGSAPATPPLYNNGTANTVDSRINVAGIWFSPPPIEEWVGFSRTFNVPISKTYYIGIGADNAFKISLNGVVLITAENIGGEPNFHSWNVYPVVLPQGENIIEMVALNHGGPGGMAAEIYNATPAELIAATQEADLNLLFSTKNLVGQRADLGAMYGYSCPEEYALDTSGGTGTYFCKKVISSTPTDKIYFSEEYCIENVCNDLVLIKGCYGNVDNKISYDCEGVYFGTALGASIGDTTVVYKHELLLRSVEVSLAAIKNTFKQGRTRNFRTEKEKIYQFFAEFVPEWYLSEIDAVFYRGEVYIGPKKYLLNETQFEKIEDCKRVWKPAATFKESCMQSFSCEIDPCASPITVCCDPVFISTEVSEVPYESGFPNESGGGGGGGGAYGDTVIIQSMVDGVPSVTGTFSPVTGITGGSTVVICAAFSNVRVFIERGNIQVPEIDVGDGSAFYTKVFGENYITFSNPLTPGELIYIETIP